MPDNSDQELFSQFRYDYVHYNLDLEQQYYLSWELLFSLRYYPGVILTFYRISFWSFLLRLLVYITGETRNSKLSQKESNY